MAGEASVATSSAIIKTLYPYGEVPMELYLRNPGLAMIANPVDFEGDPQVVPVQTEATWGASAQVTNAQANLAPSKFSKFAVSRIEDFSLARVFGQAMRAVKTKAGALVDLWEKEMQSAQHQALRSAAVMMYRTIGTGTRGQMDGVSSMAATTVTLKTLSDVSNFGVGMTVGGVSDDTLSSTVRSGTMVITGIDRSAGTLTGASNWSTAITGFTNTDFVVRDGDAQNSGTARQIVGMQGWIAGGASPGSLWGLQRNTDPVRLAGQNFSVAGLGMEEAVLEAAARVAEQGFEVDTMLCHPRDRMNLIKGLTSKIVYDRVTSPKASVGFKTLEIEGDNGTIKVVSDVNFPRNKFIVTKWDTWRFHTLGTIGQILDFDSNDFLRVSNADAYEVRCGTYGNLITTTPVASAIGTSWGQ